MVMMIDDEKKDHHHGHSPTVICFGGRGHENLETVIHSHAGLTVLHCIALGRPKTRRAAELLRLVHSHHGDLEAKNNEGQFLGRSNTIACPKWCKDFLH